MLFMFVMYVNKPRVINFPFHSLCVSKVPLELVFSDVWGCAPTYVGKNNYYVCFIDDISMFTWVYLLKHQWSVLSLSDGHAYPW
jgi:hypothetical protein